MVDISKDIRATLRHFKISFCSLGYFLYQNCSIVIYEYNLINKLLIETVPHVARMSLLLSGIIYQEYSCKYY